MQTLTRFANLQVRLFNSVSTAPFNCVKIRLDQRSALDPVVQGFNVRTEL